MNISSDSLWFTLISLGSLKTYLLDFEKISSGVFKCVYRFKRRVYNELRIDFSKNGDIQLFSPSGDIIATVEDLSDLAKILTDLSKGSLR